MTMFTIAGKSVTEEEFSRAAQVCIGRPLEPGVVSSVFHIFDVDGEWVWSDWGSGCGLTG